jgi:hypothetical protein
LRLERKSIRVSKNAEEASAMLKKKSKSIEVDEKKVKRVKKVSHLAWKLRPLDSPCGTRKLSGFMHLQCEEKKYR